MKSKKKEVNDEKLENDVETAASVSEIESVAPDSEPCHIQNVFEQTL